MGTSSGVGFKNSIDTIGLPDHVYISPINGKIDEVEFRKAIGIINRRHSQGTLGSLKKVGRKLKNSDGKHPLIDKYSDPTVRRSIYVAAIKNELNGIKKTGQWVAGLNVPPSWDLKGGFNSEVQRS